MRFKLYWLDGRTEIVTGPTIKDAVSNAGYGQGALKALDHYENQPTPHLISFEEAAKRTGLRPGSILANEAEKAAEQTQTK